MNAYHLKVRDVLTPLLQQDNDQFTINWLKKETQPIDVIVSDFWLVPSWLVNQHNNFYHNYVNKMSKIGNKLKMCCVLFSYQQSNQFFDGI